MLAALIHTTLMSEAERAACCRERGLYVKQLEAWQSTFEAMDTTSPGDRAKLAHERQKSRSLSEGLDR